MPPPPPPTDADTSTASPSSGAATPPSPPAAAPTPPPAEVANAGAAQTPPAPPARTAHPPALAMELRAERLDGLELTYVDPSGHRHSSSVREDGLEVRTREVDGMPAILLSSSRYTAGLYRVCVRTSRAARFPVSFAVGVPDPEGGLRTISGSLREPFTGPCQAGSAGFVTTFQIGDGAAPEPDPPRQVRAAGVAPTEPSSSVRVRNPRPYVIHNRGAAQICRLAIFDSRDHNRLMYENVLSEPIPPRATRSVSIPSDRPVQLHGYSCLGQRVADFAVPDAESEEATVDYRKLRHYPFGLVLSLDIGTFSVNASNYALLMPTSSILASYALDSSGFGLAIAAQMGTIWFGADDQVVGPYFFGYYGAGIAFTDAAVTVGVAVIETQPYFAFSGDIFVLRLSNDVMVHTYTLAAIGSDPLGSFFAIVGGGLGMSFAVL